MAAAVIGVTLALAALVFRLAMPVPWSMNTPLLPPGDIYQQILAGTMIVVQLAMGWPCARAVLRRWRAAPGAGVTQALGLAALMFAVLVCAHLLVEVMQLISPSQRMPQLISVNVSAINNTLLLLLIVLAVGRLYRWQISDLARRRRWERNSQVVLAAVCALSPIVMCGWMMRQSALTAGIGLIPVIVLCVPTTALALWAVHRMPRNGRLPARLVLAGFAWGAVISTGYALALGTIWQFVTGELLGLGKVLSITDGFAAPFTEEIAKAAGLLMLAIAARRWMRDLVSGVVLGASIGLGFNLTETIGYMSNAQMGGALYQHWLRQGAGLMLSHTAFTALSGAGIGLAMQLRDPRSRYAASATGLATAIGAHYACNVLIGWPARFVQASDTVTTMVVMPLSILLLQGPFLLLYVLLLRQGLRYQDAVLAVELPREVGSGHGAVLPAELAVLLHPGRRLRARIDALRHRGFAAFRTLSRIQRAQLALGLDRWFPSQAGAGSETLMAQRHCIHRLRAHPAAGKPALGGPANA